MNNTLRAIKFLNPRFVKVLNMWGPRGSALVPPPCIRLWQGKNHTSLQSFFSEHVHIHISFITLASKSAPSVEKRRQLAVFASLVPTRITFAGYVIVIFGASSGILHTKIGTNRVGSFSCANNKKQYVMRGSDRCFPFQYEACTQLDADDASSIGCLVSGSLDSPSARIRIDSHASQLDIVCSCVLCWSHIHAGIPYIASLQHKILFLIELEHFYNIQ